MEENLESYPPAETEDRVVDPRIRKVCKTMCVTTICSLMVIAWASVSMFFSGIAGYWLLATMPFFRTYTFLKWFYYPATASLAVVLLLSPAFAVAGDLRCVNFRMVLIGVIPLNVIGVVVTGVLIGVAFVAHWYYWALRIPIFLVGVPISGSLLFNEEESLILSNIILMPIIMFMFLVVFGVTSVIHCLHRASGKIIKVHRITENPVTLVSRVTRYALQHPAGHGGLLARLNNFRRSKGGPADDEEIDSVAKFWLLVLLMVSLFGFMFWDDMWAVSFVNGLSEGLNFETGFSVLFFTSSQLTTSAVVVICVPVYQLIVRPFMGKCCFLLLWRILIGLFLELISLAVVTWGSAATISRIGSEAPSDVCGYSKLNQTLSTLRVLVGVF